MKKTVKGVVKIHYLNNRHHRKMSTLPLQIRDIVTSLWTLLQPEVY